IPSRSSTVAALGGCREIAEIKHQTECTHNRNDFLHCKFSFTYGLLLTDAKTDSKRQRIEVIADTSTVAGVKIHFGSRANSEPGGKSVIVRNTRIGNCFGLRLKHAIAIAVSTALQ